ncbi:MAG: sigma-70 family RNA polymerase sigma factor [Spirochaetota bacterium]
MEYLEIHNEDNDCTIDTIIHKYHYVLIQYINNLNNKYNNILDDDEVDDVLQDIYVKLISGALEKFRGECSLKNYLLHYIARSVFIDYCKRKYSKKIHVVSKKIHNDDEDESNSYEIPDDDRMNPENIFINQEFKQILEDELQNLTAKERLIFIMVEFDGLNQSKIAEKLKIKQPTVSEHYNNARTKLQKLLKTKYPQYVDSIYYEK